jgi:thiamine-phosphate pyrophosphorylase
LKSLGRLYTFIDTAYLHGRNPRNLARQLCDGGSDLIQLRAKTSTPDEIRQMAEDILSVTRPAGVPLVINDHLAVACEIGAEFCHLGQEDLFENPAAPSKDLLASAAAVGVGVGVSSHAPEQASRAIEAGAAYIAIGPVYATATKPGAKPVTLNYVRWAAAHVKIPWFAIGGINLANLDDVLAAGARRICVVSAVLNAPDPARACHQFKERLGSAAL